MFQLEENDVRGGLLAAYPELKSLTCMPKSTQGAKQFCKPAIKIVYVIGSLRNPRIPEVANLLRAQGYEVFDDWFGTGPEADDFWMKYEAQRGRTYKEALRGHAAQMIFHFDKEHLDRADAVVMVQPAGKSGHLELGYTIGRGKPGFVLFDKEPERYEVMLNFATDIFFSDGELIDALRAYNV